MEKQLIEFPIYYFGMTIFNWHLDVRGQSGRENLTGNAQIVYGRQPRFVGSLQTTVLSKDKARAWRALVAQMRGRVNVLRIPVMDPLRLSLSDIGGVVLPSTGVTHSDDTAHSDDAGYDQSIVAAIQAVASMGASTITIDGDAVGNAINGGELISIKDYLYTVSKVSGVGVNAILTLEPPLRTDVAIGDSVDFDAKGLFVMADDMGGQLDVGVAHHGVSEIQLVEWISSERVA